MSLVKFPVSGVSSLATTATAFIEGCRYSTPSIPSISSAPPSRTVIQNVNVGDGEKGIHNTTVVIEGMIISLTRVTTGAKKVDGFLMPSLIDAHVHASDKRGLDTLAHYGATTAFDLGSFPSSDMPQWHDVGDQGITSLLFSRAAACVSGGLPSIIPGFPKNSIINSADDAKDFVETWVKEGVDFLKMFINDKMEPKQAYQNIIKERGEHYNKMLITHAPDYDPHALAHAEMLDDGHLAMPTMIMMQHLCNVGRRLVKPYDHSYSSDNLALMHKMGVPIIVGTDADKQLQGLVLYESSLHTELQFLADGEMSTEEILRSATSVPAKYLGLKDRGKIAPGMRADLLLLSAATLVNISNSKQITQIWKAGTAVKGLFGRSHHSRT